MGQAARDRVKQLEEQVVMLKGALNDAKKTMRKNAPVTNLSPTTSVYQSISDTEAFGEPDEVLPAAAGHIEWSSSSVTYVGNAHWRALLESVCMAAMRFRHMVIDVAQIPGLEHMIGDGLQTSKNARQATKPQMPGPLSGIVQLVDRAEILAALPPRDTVDILLQEAFVNTDNECSEFSVGPTQTPADSR